VPRFVVLQRCSTKFVIHPEEIDWVNRAKLGDRDAFGLLVQRYWQPLCAWLSRLAQHRQQGEDLAQEAFLKAWVNLSQLNEPKAFRVWLFRIARRLLHSTGSGDRNQGFLKHIPDDQPPPSDCIVEKEGTNRLAEEIARLPTHYREIYLLWVQDGWTFSELAEALGLNEATARWRVHKARQLLLERLKDWLAQE
jgi:RNA polymerase sigma-70 factor (ECF subfamily)